jgi:hypothetical protein
MDDFYWKFNLTWSNGIGAHYFKLQKEGFFLKKISQKS